MAWTSNFKNASARAAVLAVLLLRGPAAAKDGYDRIEVFGVEAIPASTVNELFQDDLKEGIEELKKAYFDRGYRKVIIKGSLVKERSGTKSELVVRLQVQEGGPTAVSGVDLVEVRNLDRTRPGVWKAFVESLREDLMAPVGAILTQERKRELERAIDRQLFAGEFVGSKIVSTDEVPSGDLAVRLRVSVQLGDSVTFGFQGNQAMSRKELSALIEEMRQSGFSEDYEEAIQKRIVEAYQSRAFLSARVQVRTQERPESGERHLTFVISEGARTRLGEVRFDGFSSFSEGALRGRYFKVGSDLLQAGYYVEGQAKAAADRLIDWIRSQGYLSARLVSVHPVVRGTRQGRVVDLTIYLTEGVQTLLRTVTFEGLSRFTPEEATRILGLKEGAALNLFSFTEGLEALQAAYREEAFLEFRYLNEEDSSMVRYSSKDQFADVVVKVHEGSQIRVSTITYEGLGGTSREVAEREMELKEDGLLREGALKESERKIRLLGVFASVKIEVRMDSEKPQHRKIKVIVTEGNPGRISGGAGFRNDLGLRLFGEAGYGNLWGKNHSLTFNTEFNRRIEDYCRTRVNVQTGEPQTSCFAEYELRLSYLWPWLVWGPTSFRPSLAFEHRRYNQFDAQTAALSATFERELVRSLRLVATVAYSLERTRQENAVQEADNQTLTIGGVSPSLRIDLRDDPLDPRRGFFGWLSLDYASPFLGSQSAPFPVSYARVQFRADQHFPIGEFNLFLSFRVGYERNLVDPLDPSVPAGYSAYVGVPLIKQFALGGVGSLRGYNIQEINAQDRVIQGSLSYVNYRAQLEIPLSGNLKFGPFLDAGNLRVDSFSFGGLRYGTGVGLRYRSPVGPINFDWGFKIDPLPTDVDWNRFYFSIGIL